MLIAIFIGMLSGIVLKIDLLYGMMMVVVDLVLSRHKIVTIFSIVMIYIYSFLFVSRPIESIKARVVESYSYGMILRDGLHRYFVYTNENYPLNMLIQANCKEGKMNNGGNFNAFSFENYLASKGVFDILELSNIQTSKQFSLKQQLIDYLDGLKEPVNSYSKQLLLGIKDEYSNELYDLTSSLALIHLFALSGMHLSILEKWLKKLRIPDAIIYLLLGVYVVIVGNLISLWKAYLQKVLRKITDLDDFSILALIGILFLLNNPYVIYSSSFIFSLAMAFILLICSKLKYSQFYIYIGSIPLILWNSYTLPLLGFVYMYIGGELIEIVFSILLFNACCFGLFNGLVAKSLAIFERILQFFYHYNITLIFGKPSLLFIIVFYLIYLYIILKEQIHLHPKRGYFLLSFLLLFTYCKVYLNPISEVTMIDVGQGDCFLIRYPFNQGNVLIDTGGSNSTDLATKQIIPYLKSIGVKKLDYVVISHDDTDHSGALASLLEHFQVDEVIQEGKDFLNFHYIDLGEQEEGNASSLVYTLTLNNYTYLFTGDLPSELECLVCEQIKDIDVLKVGHHGSDTSTSSYLLANTTPSIALISVGKNNLYGHPHNVVMNRLKAYGIRIYRSDLDGMVSIRSFKNYRWIETKN